MGRRRVEGRILKRTEPEKMLTFWVHGSERCRVRSRVMDETGVLEHPLFPVLWAPWSQGKQLRILPWGEDRRSLQPS